MHSKSRAGTFGFLQRSEDDDRVSHNLRRFVSVAQGFHSSASSIARDGPRPTIYAGSILGDLLTATQYSDISRWIPPPVGERKTPASPRDRASSSAISTNTTNDLTNDQGHHSDSDGDLDRDLVRRLEELAVESMEAGNYARAENFYRKVPDRKGAASDDQPVGQDYTTSKIALARACLCQEKWQEAGELLIPIAWEKKVVDIEAYGLLHALALAYKKNSDLETADSYCRRSLWGKRKVLGKSHPSPWEMLALLASICDSRDDAIEAEAHRSFIPASYRPVADTDPLEYLNRPKDDQGAPIHPLPPVTVAPPQPEPLADMVSSHPPSSWSLGERNLVPQLIIDLPQMEIHEPGIGRQETWAGILPYHSSHYRTYPDIIPRPRNPPPPPFLSPQHLHPQEPLPAVGVYEKNAGDYYDSTHQTRNLDHLNPARSSWLITSNDSDSYALLHTMQPDLRPASSPPYRPYSMAHAKIYDDPNPGVRPPPPNDTTASGLDFYDRITDKIISANRREIDPSELSASGYLGTNAERPRSD